MKVQGPPAAWSMPLTWSRSGERNVGSRFLICVDLDGLAGWSPSGLWSKGSEQRPARGSGKRTLVDRAFVARDRSRAGEPAWNATEGWASPANLREKLIALVSREARKKEAWAKRGSLEGSDASTRSATWTGGLGGFLGTGAQQAQFGCAGARWFQDGIARRQLGSQPYFFGFLLGPRVQMISLTCLTLPGLY